LLLPDTRGTLLALTVEDNLRLGAHTRRDRRAVRTDLEALWQRFPELALRARQQAGTLSGGEQQMLAIARALMARPSLLMIDEPTAGLAPRMVERVYEVLGSIRQAYGLALLMTGQEPGRMATLADRLLLLDAGRVILQGPAVQVRTHPRLREVLLGAAQ
jgi:branched-chain amino acid transport system ATP-binding protein